MKILSVKLSNFKSFSGEHSFSFGERTPGLYFVEGKNTDQPRLGSNGSGKSTLFSDAPLWVLYGKTGRGLRATNIHSWQDHGESNTWGELICDINGEIITIRREWNPNSLKVNDEIVTDDYIEKLVGLNFTEFSHSIIIHQTAIPFMDLRPSEKMELLKEILRFKVWEDCSDIAKNKSSSLLDKITSIEYRIKAIKDLLSSQKELRVALKDELEGIKKWTKEQNKAINRLIKETSQLIEESSQNLGILQNAQVLNSVSQTTIEKRDSLIDRLETELKNLNETSDQLRDASRDYKAASAELEKYNQDLKHDKGICSRCGQVISKGHAKKEIAAIEHRIDVAKLEVNHLTERFNRLKTRTDNFKERLKKINDKIEKKTKKNSEQETKIRIESANLDSQKRRLLELKGQRKNIAPKNTNNLKEKIQKSLKTSKKLQIELEDKKEKFKNLKIRQADYAYWIKAFRELRLSLIKRILSEMEAEVNNAMHQLGLVDWSISLETERITGSGSISKGFTVSVDSPKNKKPVPWESWSGGENQRLRLAAQLGLSNLLLHRSGSLTNILVIDEHTRGLSPEGIDDFLQALYDKAVNENKQIWIIDHKTPKFSGFSEIVRVINDGSSRVV